MRRRAKVTGGGGIGLALVSWAIDRLMPNAPDWVALSILGLGSTMAAYSLLSLFWGESDNDAAPAILPPKGPILRRLNPMEAEVARHQGGEAWRKNHLAAKRERADQPPAPNNGISQRRRELIDGLRRDVVWNAHRGDKRKHIRTYLSGHSSFHAIKKHLSSRFLEELDGSSWTIWGLQDPSDLNELEKSFLGELDSLESEWGLDPVPAALTPEITPTSHKGKPLVRLTEPERERVSRALLAVGDYLTNDFAQFLKPFQALRDPQPILREQGGEAYHRLVEAPRPTMRQFIDGMAEAIKPYEDEMRIVDVDVMAIKTKATPLWDAVRELSNISQLLPPGTANGEALKLPLRRLGEVLEAIQAETDRVQNEIKVWRLKISRGEL